MGVGAADFRIDDVVVGDVVAMRAPRLGGEIWRGIDGADAEPPQVRDDRGRGLERETRVYLQAVRARRNEARRLHQDRPSTTAPGRANAMVLAERSITGGR